MWPQIFVKVEFPPHLGAIDGKHVAIRCPKNGRSLYFCAIILFALVDANYKFMCLDVDLSGSSSDA